MKRSDFCLYLQGIRTTLTVGLAPKPRNGPALELIHKHSITKVLSCSRFWAPPEQSCAWNIKGNMPSLHSMPITLDLGKSPLTLVFTVFPFQSRRPRGGWRGGRSRKTGEDWTTRISRYLASSHLFCILYITGGKGGRLAIYLVIHGYCKVWMGTKTIHDTSLLKNYLRF